MKKIYIIGIGGIGISGIARYYNENGYKVFGSDKTNSKLIKTLQDEGIDIIIGEDNKRIDNSFEKVIYTEAVSKTQSEIKKALELNLKIITYPESLAEIANSKKLIAVSGTHGKSTTTSLISIMLKNSNIGINAVIGTILNEFDKKNSYFSNSDYFAIEACEYKRSFLRYKPYIGIITNIEIDHLDYYKDLEDYTNAFEDFINNIIPHGYAILNGKCKSSMSLLNLRNDINYIVIYDNDFEIYKINKKQNFLKDNNSYLDIKNNTSHISPILGKRGEQEDYSTYLFPTINMQVPGNHILFDAKIAYSIGKILGLETDFIVNSLENYKGVWRRSEIVGYTENKNLIISDYGHHPTEIKLNLKALKGKYIDKKILVVFQPHQYNRTIELLEDFKTSFIDADIIIIPNIYESRDSIEDMQKMNGEIFTKKIKHSHKVYGDGLEKTLNIINQFDRENDDLVIILLGAGDVDDLRYDIAN